MVKYTHLKLNQEIAAPAGYYTPVKEAVIDIDGREVLYAINNMEIDAACCGTTSCIRALVPGYVIEKYAAVSQDGLPVSEVEPVTDGTTRERIKKMIRETENVSDVEFW